MSQSDSEAQQSNVRATERQKRFGKWSLTLLVVASMIGSGVFTTSGFTLGAVGSPGVVVLCWLLAGGIAICGSIAYGKLAELLPQNGGEFLYLSRHVHPLAGFLGGWISLTAGFSGAIAYAAVAFERYAIPDNIRPNWLPLDSVAITVIVLCAVAHAGHALAGARFQNFVVILKSVALLTFLGIVCRQLPVHDWQTTATASAPTGSALIIAVATSLVWISLSYAGFNAAIYVAGESETQQVPGALLRATILVTVLYVILNAIFVTSAPASELAWQEDVAAIAARFVGGTKLEILIRVAICLGLFSSVAGMIQTGPRVYSRMAADGVFPSYFSEDRNGIRKSIALQAAIAIGLILIQRLAIGLQWMTSSLLGLLIFLSTTLSLSSAGCVLTLFLPSVRRRGLNFVVGAAAAIYASASLCSILLLVLYHEDESGWVGYRHLTGAAVALITGLIAYAVFGRQANSPSRLRDSSTNEGS